MSLPSGTYRLTKQQREFIRAYAWEGKTQSEAYRSAYRTNATPRGVSAQAHRLMRSPAVRAAITQIHAGDWSVLITCGVDPGLLLQKKLLAFADNPHIPPYVQVRALQAALRYKKPELEATPNRVTDEEIEQLLRENVKVADDTEPEWDDLSLDDDPSPLVRVHPRQAKMASSETHFNDGQGNVSNPASHPFFRGRR